MNYCQSHLLNIINNVVCIIWLPGAAAVPDVQGPLTYLHCNLAGNARTLLTLLLFANSLHYSYPLNCIWFHIFAHTKNHPQWIIYSTPEMDSLGYDYHVLESLLFMTQICLRLSTPPHHLSLSLLLFDLLSKCTSLRGRELVTFISSQRQSVVLNDNSRAHIVKVEAFDYPFGCPRRKANCCSALLSTFGPVPSRALAS